MKCWAKSVSECCSTQSREHYITKGLFSGKMLHVINAPFFNAQSRTIPKASLTRKCLCKKHNELLSEYDKESILLGNLLKEVRESYHEMRMTGCENIDYFKGSVSLEKFSRWFVKTYLGFHEFFKYPSYLHEDTLAKLVFSKDDTAPFLEFSLEQIIGDDFEIQESVSIAPLERGNLTFGMQIELYGICIRGIIHEYSQNKTTPLTLDFNGYSQSLCRTIKVE